MSSEREKEGLQSLGKKTEYRQDYAPEVLESFVNSTPGMIIGYVSTVRNHEFVSHYGATRFCRNPYQLYSRRRMVESKSLKLYLFSFRNHGDFHEDCVNKIMKDLIRLMDPKYIESPVSLLRVAGFPSIRMPTTAAKVRSSSRWRSSA